MSQWVALMWGIKPESRDAVRELFASYGRPDHAIKDDNGNEVGTLLQTLVFMKDDQVIRVVETTDGVDLPTLAKHMGRQPAIRELEDTASLGDILSMAWAAKRSHREYQRCSAKTPSRTRPLWKRFP